MPKQNKTKKYNPGKIVKWHGMDGRAQVGWATNKIQKRPRRSFAIQRESQVMRHIARQLFPALKEQKSDPVEIQLMWANENVFIGTNKDKATYELADMLNSTKKLSYALKKVWGKSGERYKRTRRSTGKLRRLRKWDPSDIDESKLDIDDFADLLSRGMAQEILWILDSKMAKELLCTDKSASKTALSITCRNKLFYVVEGNNHGRHIEEKFIDILENAKYTGGAIIAGVKRPCGTCWIRMENAVENGINVEFSPYPGNIWKGQAETLKLKKKDIKQYIKKGTYRSGPGGMDYDSGSDSEEDDDWFE